MSQRKLTDNNISIQLAGSKDQQQWDEYASNHPLSSPYHLFAWKLAVEEAYGHDCYYLFARMNGQYVGILPIVHIRFPGIINCLTALPYCDVGNCLCDNEVVQDALLAKALSLRKELSCKVLELRGPLKETNLKKREFQAEETRKVRMLLELPTSSDELFAGFKSKLRSQIRKAEKNGIIFRWSGLEELNVIYSVFSRNMRDLGSPVHSKEWLKSVLKHYKNRAKVGFVEFNGKAVGMGIILLSGQKVSIPWASTLREYNHLGPNMLLYWNFLKFSADCAINIFDFGRSTVGEGTFKFKKQWGAKPEPLIWYTQNACREMSNNDSRTGQNSNRKETAAEIWRNIPLTAANLIGPRIRKYITL